MGISDFFRKLLNRRKPLPLAEPQLEPRRPEERFILCIDGGGMRGIIPVVVLQHLERHLSENGFAGDIAKCFDLIAGTSTGGLISLALSCPNTLKHNEAGQVDLEALLDSYMTLGDEIFQTQSFLSIRKMVSDKYSSANIQALCRRWFGDETMASAKVPTLVIAYDLTEGRQVIIRSYADEASFPLWVAGRSTSAAPTFFSPCEYDGKLLVDGGVVANNPAIFAYFEAKRLYPECDRFHMLSISTAGSYHTMSKDETKGMLSWADNVVPMYGTAQKRTADFVLGSLSDVQYVRLDIPLPKPVKMDVTDPAALSFMKSEAEADGERFSAQLEDFAMKLIENLGHRDAT